MPPLYEFVCSSRHHFERYLPVADYRTPQNCDCGAPGRRIISVPMLLIRSKDICYDSPIDGRPITSMAARLDDLARSGCREYDPCMKQDYHRRIEREEKQLEAAIESTVDAEIAAMPSRKREHLASELQHGANVGVERITANAKPLKVEINNHV